MGNQVKNSWQLWISDNVEEIYNNDKKNSNLSYSGNKKGKKGEIEKNGQWTISILKKKNKTKKENKKINQFKEKNWKKILFLLKILFLTPTV